MSSLPKEDLTNQTKEDQTKEYLANQIHAVANEKEGQAYEPKHYFHAAAHVLKADLKAPVVREVKEISQVRLEPDGMYKFQPTGPLRVEGIISYDSGYTQVGGHKSPKPGHGFVTLTTSVVEGLNILDVLTADRVVAQISTEHPEWYGLQDDPRPRRQVPSVTFLGTRFENLRINGREVKHRTQLDILGPEPVNDKSYLDDNEVRKNVSEHYGRIKKVTKRPEWAKAEDLWWNQDGSEHDGPPRYGDMKCSLVSEIDEDIPGIPFGHVIHLPNFGKIFLAELTVTRKEAEPSNNGYAYPETYVFHLDMIRVELGCLATGNTNIATADANGGGSGTGHH
jgi:hypothetical protein